MIYLTGISKIESSQSSAELCKIVIDHTDLRDCYNQLKELTILTAPIKNFGRFDTLSKKICLGTALALKDAQKVYPVDENAGTGLAENAGTGLAENAVKNVGTGLTEIYETGILFCNEEGAEVTNTAYYQDYIDNGRKLGRGNLFIYTLPSSPVGEAAIAFGLKGPINYIASGENSVENILRHAENMIVAGEADSMLVAVDEGSILTCFLLECFDMKPESGITIDTYFDRNNA